MLETVKELIKADESKNKKKKRKELSQRTLYIILAAACVVVVFLTLIQTVLQQNVNPVLFFIRNVIDHAFEVLMTLAAILFIRSSVQFIDTYISITPDWDERLRLLTLMLLAAAVFVSLGAAVNLVNGSYFHSLDLASIISIPLSIALRAGIVLMIFRVIPTVKRIKENKKITGKEIMTGLISDTWFIAGVCVDGFSLIGLAITNIIF